ncbi:MAG: tetratricopeptide repeat protein, partial [Planctomycetota bacterium]
MTSAWVTLMLAVTYNVGLAYAMRLDVAVNGTVLKRCRWFQVLAFLGILLFDGMALRAFFSNMNMAGAFMILPVCGILGMTLLPFVLFMVGEGVDAARRSAMSEDNIKVERTYDQVEAAIKQRDFARAETLLREAMEEDPGAPEPHRRVADVLLAKGDLGGCVRELKQAAALTRDAEPKAVTMFRIADLLIERGNDPAGAEAAVKAVLYEFPGTKYVEMAQ